MKSECRISENGYEICQHPECDKRNVIAQKDGYCYEHLSDKLQAELKDGEIVIDDQQDMLAKLQAELETANTVIDMRDVYIEALRAEIARLKEEISEHNRPTTKKGDDRVQLSHRERKSE